MTLNIVVLPGDGIGPEVTDEAVRVLDWFVAKRAIVRVQRLEGGAVRIDGGRQLGHARGLGGFARAGKVGRAFGSAGAGSLALVRSGSLALGSSSSLASGRAGRWG